MLNPRDISSLSAEQVVSLILSDQTVCQTISNAAFETPEQPWTVIDIHELALDALNIDLDLDDTELFGALLSEFNGAQEAAVRELEKAQGE